MERYICIHCHFYQPPRENPWLEAIELQDAAYPYHDWNERITAECYATNALSRILDGEGRIESIVNNYAKISFNFGPTLLSWLEEHAPGVYGAIIEADRESQARFSGHGSALAQAYNHMILPLANRRDKYTQVLWGIRDFQHRFGRSPEGMWLPETAVDLESLEILAEVGLQFTILAPHQAKRVRRLGARAWRDVSGARIDPTQAYEMRLPSGRRLTLFFYDGPISRAVAFEGLLAKGEHFAGRLLSAFSDDHTWPQLVHVATDGETYGHHHRFGDMALAYALHHIQSNGLARLTNYGEYLERQPPTHQVQIFEGTSWSCAHGVERWRSDCGCNTGGHPGWNQGWREPLRDALDGLRDSLERKYEMKAASLLKDPWAARNDYIDSILDRSPENLDRFLTKHATHELIEKEKEITLNLLELQRHAMLMYTSCGWFFDDLSGIETVQVIQYAGRAVQLAGQLFGDGAAPAASGNQRHDLEAAFESGSTEGIESEFLDRLERAKSNVPGYGDGRRIYERFVKPAVVNLEKVAAHYAITSLFAEYAERTHIYCYEVDLEDYLLNEAGKMRLAMGHARFASRITGESARLSFGVLHFGDHNLNCGVREFRGEEAYQKLTRDIVEPFSRADFTEVIRFLDRHFGQSTFSLKALFRDEQRKIVSDILEATLAEAESVYRGLYENNAPLMLFLAGLGVPLPKALQTAAEFVLNSNLRRELEEDDLDLKRVSSLLEAASRQKVPLEAEGLAFTLQKTIERLVDRLQKDPEDLPLLEKLLAVVSLSSTSPFRVTLWKTENAYYEMLQTTYPKFRARARETRQTWVGHVEPEAETWLRHFTALGEKLSVRVPAS